MRQMVCRCPAPVAIALALTAVGCAANPVQKLFKSPMESAGPPEPLITSADGATDEPQWLGESSLSTWKRPLKMLDVTAMWNSSPETAGNGRMVYTRAEQLFRQAASAQGDARRDGFRDAAEVYAKVAKETDSTTLREDALYMVGESYFFADHYPRAVQAFEELVKQYPRTRHMDRVDRRRFAIAQYWEQQESSFRWAPNFTSSHRPTFDARGHAIRLYDRIRFDDPTGKLADDATMAAAVAKFEAGHYSDADILFEDLRQNFASSEHQFQAHLLLLKCKLKRYQGPEYDGTVLNEAEALIRQMLVQFPTDVEPHRAYLEEEAKSIRLKQAERLFVQAQYRDRRKEFLAARMLYEQVRSEYGDTSLGLEAEARLAQLAGLPDRPEEKLQRLADLFPKEEEAKPLIVTGNVGGKLR